MSGSEDLIQIVKDLTYDIIDAENDNFPIVEVVQRYQDQLDKRFGYGKFRIKREENNFEVVLDNVLEAY